MAPAITATVYRCPNHALNRSEGALAACASRHQRDHAGNGAFLDRLRHGHFEHAVEVDRRLEDLGAGLLCRRASTRR